MVESIELYSARSRSARSGRSSRTSKYTKATDDTTTPTQGIGIDYFRLDDRLHLIVYNKV